ncbi:DUF3575 domain-containing protein [Bacteroides sp. 519]|uniref:DUF3575 domain-containing protein n=1 Tax=Bacteroides sp. 519 TaxID=2302937 RepID=UPI0013D14285|nr:DUF3575 domain-containing protein [Bacteroides sp. 519]NDV60615.1 DUF3575 domain-containing protein [Bacteroides sp. 519]
MNRTVRMNIRIILTSTLLALTCALSAQVDGFGLRTNLLSWAALSPSLGADISWNNRYMLVVDGSYGDWHLDDDKSGIRLSGVGLEARRYFSTGSNEVWYNPSGGIYNGLYAGIDARYIRFNVNFNEKNREGNMYTAGLVLGYTFHTLNSHWVVDASFGLGYVHREYDKCKWYPPANDYRSLGLRKIDGPGLTNLNVSLAYRFKL